MADYLIDGGHVFLRDPNFFNSQLKHSYFSDLVKTKQFVLSSATQCFLPFF